MIVDYDPRDGGFYLYGQTMDARDGWCSVEMISYRPTAGGASSSTWIVPGTYGPEHEM